jgi:hypothetical protein
MPQKQWLRVKVVRVVIGGMAGMQDQFMLAQVPAAAAVE